MTGGAGFIGSHLCDALVDRGDEVVVIDDLSSGRVSNLASLLETGTEFHAVSVTERDRVIDITRTFAPDVVFHLAAQIDVRKSITDPGFDATVNIAGTANVLEAARLAGTDRFLLASTGGAIYGEGTGRTLPLSEAEPAAPLAPYGQSKLAAEGYLSLYKRLYGLDGIALRFGNVYGPRQDPLGEAGVVAIFCGRLLAGESPIVYGTGEQTRDYIYVMDVVEAMLIAASSPAQGPFNIGTGEETSVLELIAVLASGDAEGDFRPTVAEAREGEVQRISIDPSLAAGELGWQAKTKLRDGLLMTLESSLEASV